MQCTNVTVVASATGAGSGNIVTNKYDTVILAAENLAGAEEVDIFIIINGVEVVVTDAAGDPAKLTLAVPTCVLEGGPMYRVEKDSTAGACGVFAILRRTSPSN